MCFENCVEELKRVNTFVHTLTTFGFYLVKLVE